MWTNSLLFSDLRISEYSCLKILAIAFLTDIASFFLIGIPQELFEKWSTQTSKYGDLFDLIHKKS